MNSSGRVSSRRRFLKLTGLSLLGLGASPVLTSVASVSQTRYGPDKDALKARQWAMVVDMSKCKDGCTDCITACHEGHNVPYIDEPRHEIKWIWHEEYENTFPSQHYDHLPQELHEKPFMVLCNHCVNPPCVRVCPTQATFKREDGIVLMDFHRCIGCRFCMAACPYGARSFNWVDPRKHLSRINPIFPTRSKGVVEKCNFCAERLAKGLAPLCVNACKEKALLFGDLDDIHSPVREALHSHHVIRRKPGLGTGPNIFYIV
ncbi:MAG: 4Fe-4S dicluster domain-containing protein [Deltaproteobacteria bacterium]|nr:4Fe-4S dicluster domain-containing protein [Deltaproteobacteria bacterium]